MKIINTLIGIVITGAIIWLASSFYKSSIQDSVVTDLQTKTQTFEGEAIEKALQINSDTNKLSDDDIESRLQFWGDYRADDESTGRPRGEQVERVPSLQNTPIINARSPKIQETSGGAQRPIPITLPRQGCRIEYGFDSNRKVIEVEVCEDGG